MILHSRLHFSSRTSKIHGLFLKVRPLYANQSELCYCILIFTESSLAAMEASGSSPSPSVRPQDNSRDSVGSLSMTGLELDRTASGL